MARQVMHLFKEPQGFAAKCERAVALPVQEPDEGFGEGFKGQLKAQAQFGVLSTLGDEGEAVINEALDELGSDTTYDEIVQRLPKEIANSWFETVARDSEGAFEGGDMNKHEIAERHDSNDEFYHENLGDLLSWLRDWLSEHEKWSNVLEAAALIRESAFCDAYDLTELGKLARYESHLYRRYEKKLSMLLKLQELRRRQETE